MNQESVTHMCLVFILPNGWRLGHEKPSGVASSPQLLQTVFPSSECDCDCERDLAPRTQELRREKGFILFSPHAAG